MFVSVQDSVKARLPVTAEIDGEEAFRRAAAIGRGAPPLTGMRQSSPCAGLRGEENTISRLSPVHVEPLVGCPSNVSWRGDPPTAGATKISSPLPGNSRA